LILQSLKNYSNIMLLPVLVTSGAEKIRMESRASAALLFAVEHDRIVHIMSMLAFTFHSVSRDVKITSTGKPELASKLNILII
jgi:hypothetical protein